MQDQDGFGPGGPVLAAALREADARFARAATTSRPWREAYPGRVRRALSDWDLEVVGWFGGGAGEPVYRVRRGGEECVLKVSGDPHLRDQAATMAAAPAAYARVLAVADDGDAYLSELLGDDLWSATTEPREQCAVIGGLLARAWDAPPGAGYQLGEPKATQLLAIVRDLGPRYGAGHPAALQLAAARASALAADEAAEVLCHGDPHPGNVLRRGDGWALIDPDGWRGERAYDLGVVLRDHCRELDRREAERPGSGVEELRACAALLGEAAGVDPERVWAWGFVERVTTGLYLAHLGYPDQSAVFLRAADVIAAAE